MPLFRDTIPRQVTGDVARALPSVVRLESGIDSTTFLERNGIHLESDLYAPLVNPDDFATLRRGDIVTINVRSMTADGQVVTAQSEALMVGELHILTEGVLDLDVGAILPPPEEVTEIPIEQPQEPEILPAPEPEQGIEEDVPAADDPGAIEEGEPPVQPEEGLVEEELPVEGCESFVDVLWDEQLQDYVPVTYHWNGVSWDLIV